jgi:hypothetical protein
MECWSATLSTLLSKNVGSLHPRSCIFLTKEPWRRTFLILLADTIRWKRIEKHSLPRQGQPRMDCHQCMHSWSWEDYMTPLMSYDSIKMPKHKCLQTATSGFHFETSCCSQASQGVFNTCLDILFPLACSRSRIFWTYEITWTHYCNLHGTPSRGIQLLGRRVKSTTGSQ